MRALCVVLLLAGCNAVFGLDGVTVVDASIDATVPDNVVALLPLDTLSDSATPDVAAGPATCVECPRQASGKIDNAMEFSGTAQLFQLPARDTLETTSAYTVAFWFNLKEAPIGSASSCAVQKAYGSLGFSWQFCVDSTLPSPTAHYTVQDTGTVEITRAGFTLNTWHHVALTWTGSAINLYIDGATPSADSAAQVKFDGGAVTIGGQLSNGAPIYAPKGLIDDVRIYDVALSLAEIQALATP